MTDFNELKKELEADAKDTAESMKAIKDELKELWEYAKQDNTLDEYTHSSEYKTLWRKLNNLSNQAENIASRLHAIETL